MNNPVAKHFQKFNKNKVIEDSIQSKKEKELDKELEMWYNYNPDEEKETDDEQ